MQNDSLNAVENSPEAFAADSAAPLEIGISIRTDSVPTVVRGDTFELKVNVSWQAPAGQGALLILPTGSANTKGITQLGIREEHSRIVQGENAISKTQFIYTLLADDTGSVSIPPLRFQIPTQDGSKEFLSEGVSFHVESPSNAVGYIACALGLVLLAAGIFTALFKRKKRLAKERAETLRSEAALTEEFLLLKKRIAKADSRTWLLDLEKICKSWAKKRYGSESLEELSAAGILVGWESLLEEFAHARYGGGARDAFENKESWKLAAKLLNIEEEE